MALHDPDPPPIRQKNEYTCSTAVEGEGMMRAAKFTIAIVLGIAATAVAQDGGKLTWMGKEGDPKTAMLDARDQNRPIMLFFTSQGCEPCKQLSEGAFSDSKVVEASRNVACIFVDCNWGNKNQELSTKYGVKVYPTVLFCDPQGKAIARLVVRDAETVAKALQALVDAVGAKAVAPVPMVTGKSYEAGLADARRKNRPLLLYFNDDSPASISMNETLLDRSLVELHPKFSTAKLSFVKGSAECLKFGVTRAPTILILDGRMEKPEEKPLARIEGSRTPREVKRELEACLPSRESEPASAGGGGDLPSVQPTPPPQEKLSDDVVERQFIWARVAVAQETLKRGSKPKAIEILEDVLKSYPKHKDTEEVRQILEDMRKK
jgi:thiol-disulfide isomerase/thioredoxin